MRERKVGVRVALSLFIVIGLTITAYGVNDGNDAIERRMAGTSPTARPPARTEIPFSEQEKIVKRSDSKQKVMAKLPRNLSRQDKVEIERLVDQSLNAIRAGDTQTAASTTQEVRMRLNTSPWESCGDHCQHHLDAGDAEKYGVCYWACVIRGGPSALLVPTERPPQVRP